jgi:hypothetical protein
MKKIPFLLLVWVLFAGCKEELEEPATEAFIFGRWNLTCENNCIQVYKLDRGQLYIDNMNSFRESPTITYRPDPLSAEFARLAEDLKSTFPDAYLRPRGLDFIACPACQENGGYYLAFDRDTEILWWQIGNIPEIWPEEIRPFMQKLEATMAKLPAQ